MKSVSIEPFEAGTVRGFLHRPLQAAPDKLILSHGAGSNCCAPLLIAVATAFCELGYTVLRCDLPFRQRRRFGPPSPKLSGEDRAGLKAAVNALRAGDTDRVFLGGHSYGGRQATILAADEPQCCDGLLLLSYPLHPPKKPDDVRTSHFPRLRTPALFVHGTADPFGSIEEMRSAIELIPASSQLITINSAGHDLARGNFDIATLVVATFQQLVCESSA
jgi:uncharacterized protein